MTNLFLWKHTTSTNDFEFLAKEQDWELEKFKNWRSDLTAEEFIELINADCTICPLECGEKELEENTCWDNLRNWANVERSDFINV